MTRPPGKNPWEAIGTATLGAFLFLFFLVASGLAALVVPMFLAGFVVLLAVCVPWPVDKVKRRFGSAGAVAMVLAVVVLAILLLAGLLLAALSFGFWDPLAGFTY